MPELATDGAGESRFVISGLTASVGGKEILRGIDIEIGPGEVHAVMGPNGAGKSTLSHIIMGKPGYEVTGGSVTLDGVDLLALPTWKRAQAGLFLAMQYPTEVPGVSLVDMLANSSLSTTADVDELDRRLKAEADRIGFDHQFLARPLNVDLSGGEKKRNETLQLGVVKPRYAILDELDSGLDIDGLRLVARRVEAATEEDGLGVLVITHYSRLLNELKPDQVHVLAGGRIARSGGPELADELEASGYTEYVDAGSRAASTAAGRAPASELDPFADPLA